MQIFLMAAGLGTRMEDLCESTPKPLLVVAGKPFIKHWLDYIGLYSKVTNVFINTHSHHSKMDDFINNVRREFKYKIHLLHEPELLGTGHTLFYNKDKIADNIFCVIYADVFSRIDFDAMFLFHKLNKCEATLYAQAELDTSVLYSSGILKLDRKNRVIKFVEKPKTIFSNYIACAIYMCNKSIIDKIENENDFSRVLMRDDISKFAYFQANTKIYDMGTKERYNKLLQKVEDDSNVKKDFA